MNSKKPYIAPQTEVVLMGTTSDTMLDIPIYSQGEGIEVGAKEQDYDFDDWSVDPWEDHIWQEEEKTDIWND